MENEVELGRGTEFGDDGVLTLFEDLGLQFDGTGLVVAVNVAEGRGESEPSEGVERLVDGDHVLGGGVELFLGSVFGAGGSVFLTTDDAGFDFEDDAVGGALL